MDIPERPPKPVFVDENVEWEDESTFNTPAKGRLQDYLSDDEQHSEGEQPVIISSAQPPPQQIDRHQAEDNSSAGQSAKLTQSSNQLKLFPMTAPIDNHPLTEESKGPSQMVKDAENSSSSDEEDAPQSQLLQKLFPTVR